MAGFNTQTACGESAEAVKELFTINTVNHQRDTKRFSQVLICITCVTYAVARGGLQGFVCAHEVSQGIVGPTLPKNVASQSNAVLFFRLFHLSDIEFQPWFHLSHLGYEKTGI